MRKTVKIRSREVSVVKVLAALIVCSLIAAGVTIALVSIGAFQVDYEITPTTAQAPTMTPTTVNLDLGSIPSGSSGDKDFGKVATLNLAVGYEITMTLNTPTAVDFPTFYVDIYLYKPGETWSSYSFYLSPTWNTDSKIVGAGTYDVQVMIEYTAVTVTSARSGSVYIDVSYPG